MLVVLATMILVFLESARRQRNEALQLEFRFRLFALRDKLRDVAVGDPRQAQNWVFQYLDSTIAKSIHLLPLLSIWYVLGLWLTHRKDSRLDKVRAYLQREYAKPDNKAFRQIEEEFTGLLGRFVVSRHILLLVLSSIAVALPVAIVSAVREAKRRSLELVVEAPETSTLHKFIPATA